MARKRRSASQAAGNWHTRVGQSAGAYKTAVQDPSVDWVGPATSPATTTLRDTNLMAAITDGSINKGMTKAGNAKWSAATGGKGVQNWSAATASAAAQAAYQAAMGVVEADYSAADAAMNAVGPGASTDERINRAAAWARSMHAQKVARGSRA